MLAVLIIAILLLAYLLGTQESRNQPAPDWVTPQNGYGRHGAHASKKF